MTQQVVKDQMRSLLQRVKEKEAKSSGERLKRTKREKKLSGRVQKKPSKKHVSETQKNFLEDNVAALKESSAEASSQSREVHILSVLKSRQPTKKVKKTNKKQFIDT